MKRAWQVTGTVFAVLFALWAQQSWTLSLTDALGPGPGFFPFWLALIGLALAIALVLRAARDTELDPVAGPDTNATLFPRGRALLQVMVVFGALGGVALLLDLLGFRIVVAIFCLVILPTLGARNRPVIVTFALMASLGVHAIFSDLLKVPLPVGVLGF